MTYEFKLAFLKDVLGTSPNINTQKEKSQEEKDSISVVKDTIESVGCKPKICITKGRSWNSEKIVVCRHQLWKWWESLYLMSTNIVCILHLAEQMGSPRMLFAVCEVQVHDSLQADTAIRQHTAATEMLKE